MHGHGDPSKQDQSAGPSSNAFIPPPWSPKSAYPKGAMVWFGGCYWRCEVPHRSNDLSEYPEPPSNLHLWTPFTAMQQIVPPQHMQHPFAPPAYAHTQYAFPRSEQEDDSEWTVLSGDETPDAQPGKPLPPAQDKEPNSRDLEESKIEANIVDELEGRKVWHDKGLGVWTYSNDPEIEEARASVWTGWSGRTSKEAWIKAARERTKAYNESGHSKSGMVMWKLVETGGAIPEDAIPVGHEGDGPILFAGRAFWAGGMHLGKAAPTLYKGCSISFGGQEVIPDTFEVLCGDVKVGNLQWMRFRHGEHALIQGWQPVEGGREADGRALLVAKAEHGGGVHPGKCVVHDDHACLPYGGGEVWVRPFEILAYKSS